jgi:hypothetical protein
MALGVKLTGARREGITAGDLSTREAVIQMHKFRVGCWSSRPAKGGSKRAPAAASVVTRACRMAGVGPIATDCGHDALSRV